MSNNRRTGRFNDEGFTLVELMIVVFILGLLSSIVLFSLPERPAKTSREVDRSLRVFQIAAREAIASGEPIGWAHTDIGHEFRRYRFGKWQFLDDGPLTQFDQLAFADGVTVSTEREEEDDRRGRTILAGLRKDDEKPAFQPDLVFFPTGAASFAEIQVDGPDGSQTILINSSGGISVKGREFDGP